MPEYFVTWEVNLTADSPEEAAQIARDWQLDPDMEATCFTVEECASEDKFSVDLMEEPEDRCIKIWPPEKS